MRPPRIPRRLIRAAVTSLQQVRKIVWFFTRVRSYGVHAAPFTPEGKVVLVWLTYADGWRCPGGGRREREAPDDAVLRELREEIGLTAHGALRLLGCREDRPDFRRDTSHLFLISDVRYRALQNLEIERVAEFDPLALPPETTALTRRHVALALDARAATRSP
jgi:8-oxo-dGTP pyrophosphatase MutT (NUDIX family)